MPDSIYTWPDIDSNIELNPTQPTYTWLIPDPNQATLDNQK